MELTYQGKSLTQLLSSPYLITEAVPVVTELDILARDHAKEAVKSALIAGIILNAVKAQLPKGAWTGWLLANCPKLSKPTAYRYMALASALQNEIEASEEVCVGEKSLNLLYQEYGIVRKETAATWGGSREGAGRPPANPDPAIDAVRVWTHAAEAYRRIPDTSYKFLPLREAEGMLVELDSVRARLKTRISELKNTPID